MLNRLKRFFKIVLYLTGTFALLAGAVQSDALLSTVGLLIYLWMEIDKIEEKVDAVHYIVVSKFGPEIVERLKEQEERRRREGV